jgi:hypothetical protein
LSSEETEAKDAWAPIKIDTSDLLMMVGYGLFVYVFIALYLIFIDVNIRTLWVLFNIVIGYAILSNEKARKYYGNMFKGFKEGKVWMYAVLNLILVIMVVAIPAILFAPSGNGGDSEANPFVSSAIFLLFLIPIVPLFADAETKIFQGWIIKGLNRNQLMECPHCNKKTLPVEVCNECGNKLLDKPVFDVMQYMPAIVISGFIFAIAHVILVGSILPMVIIIGGILLGYLYVKEGSMLVAKVHMLYNYLVIGIIIIGVLL